MEISPIKKKAESPFHILQSIVSRSQTDPFDIIILYFLCMARDFLNISPQNFLLAEGTMSNRKKPPLMGTFQPQNTLG